MHKFAKRVTKNMN